MNTIYEHWQRLEAMVMPPDAPPEQVQEMRRSFYAGARAVLRIQASFADDAMSDAAIVGIMVSIHDECQRFAESVLRGEA